MSLQACREGTLKPWHPDGGKLLVATVDITSHGEEDLVVAHGPPLDTSPPPPCTAATTPTPTPTHRPFEICISLCVQRSNMAALHLKLSLRIDPTVATPASIADIFSSEVIRLDEWMGSLTNVDLPVVPGVVLEVQVIFDADAATTLITSNEEGMEFVPTDYDGTEADHHLADRSNDLTSDNNTRVDHVDDGTGAGQMQITSVVEHVSFSDIVSNLSGQDETMIDALGNVALQSQTPCLQPVCFETTVYEVLAAGDIWPTADILAGIGMPADDGGYETILTNFLEEPEQPNIDSLLENQPEGGNHFALANTQLAVQMNDLGTTVAA
ncbi:hypothetical protein FB567DRAFT_553443 [Paraphoma chrysanthemicola]|uniref:Uncharacterized protein n=1 Tax=Paraphoma chrysanthemicola TaxID=798071 RepID=A0A8K0QX00_9PLEO|nr:hypothetical protein FB567DRAFT_553443 [Paraphoma chrysanthemicola]